MSVRIPPLRVLALLTGWWLLAAAGDTGTAPGLPVDVELVLAIDSSASVDTEEFDLQARGLAEAFRDPAVLDAIAAGPFGRIAVLVVEWSGAGHQQVNVPWILIDSKEAAERLAADLEDAPRQVETGPTSISEAIKFSLRHFLDNGFEGTRRVIDVSGDGRNNQGSSLPEAHIEAAAANVTINGLAIENEDAQLGFYYEDEVINGPGAFMMRTKDYVAYATAIRAKLLREIRSAPIS